MYNAAAWCFLSSPSCFCYNEKKGERAAMDRKQKERLRFLLKARRRANKVLAARREAALKKQDHDQRLKANQELKKQYTQDLSTLAQESGILALAEQAALQRGGSLAQEVSYYVYYGLSSSSFQNPLGITNRGELRASHLALKITWPEAGVLNEVEVRVHKNGMITFHNFLLPIFPFLWRRFPRIMQILLNRAQAYPAHPAVPVKMGKKL